MTVCVIEINDAALTLADASGVQVQSPGYALAEGGRLLVGAPACARARLNPRAIHDRFWLQLDQQPLSRPAGPATSHAELAYFHLQAVWAAAGADHDEVFLSVPAGWDTETLALLLGIAQSLSIPVTGVLPSSLAAAAAVAGAAPRLVVDAQLHRFIGDTLRADDGLALTQSRVLTPRGLDALYDAWAGHIAARFVRETRYDPQHEAASEQQLYDGLPGWLDTLRSRPGVQISLAAGVRSHHIELSATELAAVAQPLYAPILDAAGQGALVVLGARAAVLPGLEDALAARAPVCALSAAAPAAAALALADSVRSDAQAPAYVTRLPGPMPEAQAVPQGEPPAVADVPTHLLHGWQAYPLTAPLLLDGGAPRLAGDAAGVRVQTRANAAVVSIPAGMGVTVNDQPAQGDVTLAVGDCIRVGDSSDTCRLIAQVAPDAA